MKVNVHIRLLASFFLLTVAAAAHAQPGFQVDIKKEKPFEERKLKSEKTGEGPIKAPKRIWANVTTQFNYHFNANNKLNEIIDRAKQQHKDDYAQLLPFYNYSLNTTAADSAQLDSVISKCRTALVNHDLRGEWTDEMYLLWARSWHYQKKLDSAALMLQFINYAYAPQEEYGYYSYIGSRKDGAQELSIATPEKKKVLHSNTFGRNESFIWQVRTLTELENYTRAGSLITTLKRDPVFPKRLNESLHEAEAYWWYKQGRWDSAAKHLIAALDAADGKREKARWYYLIAQLMEHSGNNAAAAEYYTKAISSTPDPVMEVYGRLNLVRISKEGGENAADKNIAELLKMAKRDKYEEYRDIIYFMAAQMEMERGNIAAAQELLLKGAKYNNGNLASRNRAFLQIADLSYNQKKYVQAAAFYDSLQVNDLSETESSRVFVRKPPLQTISAGTGTINRQDSLQRIAAMAPEEREDYINKLVKRLRKEQGLKDEGPITSGANPLTTAGQGGDMFTTSSKGIWDNPNARAQGVTEFKRIWGTRPNADNWRRFAVVSQSLLAKDPMNTRPGTDVLTALDANGGTGEITVETLSARLPLTQEAVKASNDSIRTALLNMGAAYINQIEDHSSAIETYNELRRRFPDAEGMDEVLFNLHFASAKSGNAQAAADAKRELLNKFPSSRYAAILSTGKDPQALNDKSPEATKAYENVYNLFIEGRFNEAITAKRVADSTYKTTFWQPQLLYIEAVYNIKQRDDSAAIKGLQTIIKQNSNSALTSKAENLVNVLGRRRQIEDELNAYQMGTGADTASTKPVQQPVVQNLPPKPKPDTVATTPAIDPATLAAQNKRIRDSLDAVFKNSLAAAKKDSLQQAQLQAQARRDSLALAKQQAATARRDSIAKASAEAQLKKEALAQIEKNRRDSLATAKAAREQARKDSVALAQALRRQAYDSAALSRYLAQRAKDSTARVNRELAAAAKKQADEAKRDSLARMALLTQQRKDSLAQLAQARRDSIVLAKSLRDAARRDSISKRQAYLQQQRDSAEAARRNAKPPVPQGPKSIYSHTPDAPHLALMILEKVDPVFVNEARNAFFRFSREKYYGQPIDVQVFSLTADTKLLLVTGLANEQAAVEYAGRAKALAPTEIVPWLTGNKYTFSVISAANMEVLKANPDLNVYKKFLEQYLPVKF